MVPFVGEVLKALLVSITLLWDVCRVREWYRRSRAYEHDERRLLFL